MLAVRKDSKYKTLADLIEAARSSDRPLTFGTPGVNSGNHISAEIFSEIAKVKLLQVPYKGSSEAMVDLIRGEIDMVFTPLSNVMPLRDQLRSLVIASSAPSPFAPDIPTSEAAGIPGYRTPTWGVLFAPAGTPNEIVKRLNVALASVFKDPSLAERFAKQGVSAEYSAPEQFGPIYAADYKLFGDVIRSAGLKAEP